MPISFTCPHCGKQTSVADQYAGQSGPCASCGQKITIPGPVSTAAVEPVYVVQGRRPGHHAIQTTHRPHPVVETRCWTG
jgi:predicted RNA-binding Zn-ribbon protein involved in translation (DUF1610 family)